MTLPEDLVARLGELKELAEKIEELKLLAEWFERDAPIIGAMLLCIYATIVTGDVSKVERMARHIVDLGVQFKAELEAECEQRDDVVVH